MTLYLCKSTQTAAGSDVLAAGRGTSSISAQKDRPSSIDGERTLIGPDAAVEFSLKLGLGLFVLLLCMAWAAPLHADVIAISGTINQSTEDGTGPAENNPSLNDIKDGELYTFSLDFTGSITAPGTYDLTGSSLLFSVAVAGAVESSFDFVSLTVAQSGGFDQLSILGCLTTGSACNQGNELDLNFTISSANLNGQNVAAQGDLNLLPLDLLEDDGVTDIHGLITTYSYTSAAAVPEPASFMLLASGLAAVALKRLLRR